MSVNSNNVEIKYITPSTSLYCETNKITQAKNSIARWLFVFLLITTLFSMMSYYYQSKIDKVNTEINNNNKIEISQIKQDIEMIRQNKVSPVKSNIIDSSALEAERNKLNYCNDLISKIKILASIYVCLGTAFTLFKPDSSLVNSVCAPGVGAIILMVIYSIFLN